MYGKVKHHDTVYFEYVKANVVSILGAGEGGYDMKELATAIGLKPTYNFKRRVMQLVDLGLVVADIVVTERGSLKAVFKLPEVEKGIESK